jgi:hypothetical protein
MTSADLGGSQVCKDPYPHTYTAAGYEEARRCQLAAGHTGNHLWNSYSWEPTDLGGSWAGSTVERPNVFKPDGRSVPMPVDAMLYVVLEEWEKLRADLEAARQQRMELFNQTRELKADLEAAQAEIEWLKEERAEWESFHTAESEMRGLIESHMDMSRSEWSCVQELAQAQARIAAQDKVIEAAQRFRLARSDNAAAQAIRDLCAALDAAQEPSGSQ